MRSSAVAAVVLALAIAGLAHAQTVKLLVQSSPLAGFRYGEASLVWADLRLGDRLDLVREPDNPHDGNAVRVEWRGRKLGYVPRDQNGALAWAMDRGETVTARLGRLQEHRNPRLRIEFEVFVE
ncbi:MAG TPA: HIRAN domain-containing protein [Burkholderiales bacterium]|nr:HIRAN domain-containing protein [Burkholderiales bacterium]